MRYSGPERDEHGPWFTLGKLEVTTTTFVVLLWSLTVLIFAVEPVDKPIMRGMSVIPDQVAVGEVWRIVTWPFSHFGFGLWDIIGAAVFWLFGTDLERQVGRRPFAVLIGSSVVIIGVVATVVGVFFSGSIISGIGLLSLTVIALYIAEHPTRPFFFNIPAWVLGAVFAAIELINDLAYRDWLRLLTIVVSAGLIALVARKVELLTLYDRIPNLSLPRRKRGSSDHGLHTAGSPGGSSAPAREPKRASPLWGKGEAEEAEIVPMPTASRRRPPARTAMPDVSADDLALDLLLDKISEGGMDSLTAAERRELDELRARRRGA